MFHHDVFQEPVDKENHRLIACRLNSGLIFVEITHLLFGICNVLIVVDDEEVGRFLHSTVRVVQSPFQSGVPE